MKLIKNVAWTNDQAFPTLGKIIATLPEVIKGE